MPTEWWLRPVSSAARVAEQTAQVWKRVYLRPLAARRSAVGVLIGPPKALEAAKPTSSMSTTSTFGAPFGGPDLLDRREDRRRVVGVEEHGAGVRLVRDREVLAA